MHTAVDDVQHQKIPSPLRHKNTLYMREWRAKHQEENRECARRWRADHPDESNALVREWRLANPDKWRDIQNRSRQKRKEKKIAKWREENPEEAKWWDERAARRGLTV